MAETDSLMPESEDRLLNLKQLHFRGRAKVAISQIAFEPTTETGARTLDEKNVVRIINVFELEGCHRLYPEHAVPGIITESALGDALSRSKLSQSDLLTQDPTPRHLSLPPTAIVTALHGQHRIQAAKVTLDPLDQWWVVDLYTDCKIPK